MKILHFSLQNCLRTNWWLMRTCVSVQVSGRRPECSQPLRFDRSMIQPIEKQLFEQMIFLRRELIVWQLSFNPKKDFYHKRNLFFSIHVEVWRIKGHSSSILRKNVWSKRILQQLLAHPVTFWSGLFRIENKRRIFSQSPTRQWKVNYFASSNSRMSCNFFLISAGSNEIFRSCRIFNRTEIPINIYQADVRREAKKHWCVYLQAEKTINYILEKQQLKHFLTCSVNNGSEKKFDRPKLREAEDSFVIYSFIFRFWKLFS